MPQIKSSRSKIGQRLTRRYRVALLLIFGLSSSGLLYLHGHLNEAYSDGLVINLSGQQRMLSQRAALYATISQGAPSPEARAAALEILRQDLATMEAAHAALAQGTPAGMVRLLPSVPADSHSPDQLDAAMRSYITAAEAVLAGDDRASGALQARSAALLPLLHAAVVDNERIAAEKIAHLSRIERLLWALTVLVLLLEAWFIFRPTVRIVESTLARAEALRDEAQAARRAQERFLATMSHEIRTPLNAIIGSAQLIQEHPLAPPVAAHMSDLDRASRHLLMLLNNILDASKLKAGELSLSPAPTSLSALLGDVQAICQPLAAAKGLALRLDAPDQPQIVELDANRARQILLNLVSNALKFTSEGHVRITARAQDGGLSVQVSDTGPGIPEDRLDQLFAPFRRLTDKSSGSGLGLTISRELATLMGGTLELAETGPAGSTFALWLPAPLRASVPPAPAAAPLVARRPGAPLRVLVAEDNAVNQHIIRTSLEGIGCRVTVLEHGRLALEAARAHPFDVLIVDNQMPVMDGEQTIRAIRSLTDSATDARVPILVLTADATTTARDRTLAAGATAYMTKPIGIESLRTQVMAMCAPTQQPQRRSSLP